MPGSHEGPRRHGEIPVRSSRSCLSGNSDATGEAVLNAGGIVLCGGKSTRMGTSKALLPFGPETMLQRVVRILAGLVSPIVAVAAADQELPPLPTEVLISRDEREGRGPL